MLRFNCDYLEGAHPAVMERLLATNLEQTPGYGEDHYCDSARDRIRDACRCPDARVFFTVGGTQTNTVVLASLLGRCEGVIAAGTGHISLHEAGAIEYTGHKVITLEGSEAKLRAAEVEDYMKSFYADPAWSHMVIPGAVYISHPTEYGTLYTLDELRALRRVCDNFHLKLYMDGARLGYALAAEGTDVDLPAIACLCDAFYIGGTKVGALFGEAVVFTREGDGCRFFTEMKQHGAVLAKGRLLGLQFDTLFTDDLYLRIAAPADRLAVRIRERLCAGGYRVFMDSCTNQQFFIMENRRLEELEEHVALEKWGPFDSEHSVVRITTSWATTEQAVEELLAMM